MLSHNLLPSVFLSECCSTVSGLILCSFCHVVFFILELEREIIIHLQN